MTRKQALLAVAYSHKARKTSSAVISAAYLRYVVYDLRGNLLTDTDDLVYARAVALHNSGTIADRWAWRKTI